MDSVIEILVIAIVIPIIACSSTALVMHFVGDRLSLPKVGPIGMLAVYIVAKSHTNVFFATQPSLPIEGGQP